MLPAEVVAFAGLLGLAVGSMLNVAIDRLPKGESIVTVPSHCEACGHRLAPLDLVPVISFLLLRGRCRYCGARIPGRIPLVELTTGILFSFIAWRYGAVPESPVLMAFVGFIIVVVVVDLRHLLILALRPSVFIVVACRSGPRYGRLIAMPRNYPQNGANVR